MNKMIKPALVIMASLAVLAPSFGAETAAAKATGSEPDIADIAKKVFPSVVRVEVQNHTRRVATGVVVEKGGYIVTTALISPRDEKISVTTSDGKTDGRRVPGLRHGDPAGPAQGQGRRPARARPRQGGRPRARLVDLRRRRFPRADGGRDPGHRQLRRRGQDPAERLGDARLERRPRRRRRRPDGRAAARHLHGGEARRLPVPRQGTGGLRLRDEQPGRSALRRAWPWPSRSTSSGTSSPRSRRRAGSSAAGWASASDRTRTDGPSSAPSTAESPAELAKLREGDVVLKIGDKDVTGPDVLAAEIRKRKPGQDVTLKIERDGKPMDVKVKLGELAEDEAIKEMDLRFPGLFGPDAPRSRAGAAARGSQDAPKQAAPRPLAPTRPEWSFETRKYIGLYCNELNRELAEHFGVKEGTALIDLQADRGRPGGQGQAPGRRRHRQRRRQARRDRRTSSSTSSRPRPRGPRSSSRC